MGARNSADVAADFNGPIDEEGTFLYRMIAFNGLFSWDFRGVTIALNVNNLLDRHY